MKKEDYIKEVMRMVKVMNGNHFLLPRTWSETIDIDLKDWSYRTYCADTSSSESLYIHIEIHKDEKQVVNFHFNKSDIIISTSVENNITAKDMYDYISTIYNEKHSFSEHNEGLKALRKKIRKQKSIIKSAEKEIDMLEKEVQGLKDLQEKSTSDNP